MVSECRRRQVSQADDDDRTLTNLRLGSTGALDWESKSAKPGGWLGESGSRFWWNVPLNKGPGKTQVKNQAGTLLALSSGEGGDRWMDGISDGDGMEAVSLGAEKSWLSLESIAHPLVGPAHDKGEMDGSRTWAI